MRLAIIALIFWCTQLPTSFCSVLLQVLDHICSSLLLSQVTFRYSLLESKTRLGDLNVIKGQTCSGNSRPRQVRGYLSASWSSYEQHAKLPFSIFVSEIHLLVCATYSEFNLPCYSIVIEREKRRGLEKQLKSL